MTTAATSIKLPRRLKTKVDRLARRTGQSAHALMLRAVEDQVEALERYQTFLEDGVSADEAMQRSGLGYAAEDLYAYLDARVAARQVRRPRPVRWRK